MRSPTTMTTTSIRWCSYYGTESGNLEDGAIAGADGPFCLPINVASFEKLGRFKPRVDAIVNEIHNLPTSCRNPRAPYTGRSRIADRGAQSDGGHSPERHDPERPSQGGSRPRCAGSAGHVNGPSCRQSSSHRARRSYCQSAAACPSADRLPLRPVPSLAPTPSRRG